MVISNRVANLEAIRRDQADALVPCAGFAFAQSRDEFHDHGFPTKRNTLSGTIDRGKTENHIFNAEAATIELRTPEPSWQVLEQNMQVAPRATRALASPSVSSCLPLGIVALKITLTDLEE